MLTLALFACALASAPAHAETRLALVIGNSAYREVAALPNPARDAAAMSELLAAAGFKVTPANDLTQSGLRRVLRDFADQIAASGPDSVALVYYAGHGVQVDGDNYLVPVDARIEREADLPIEAVRLTDVMNTLSAVPARTRIVILDACRNNPFAAIDKSIGKGLAIVDAPRGSIVSYSTSPGATAYDGEGEHSPFTAALLDVARHPGLAVEQAFKQVRLAVNRSTDGRQTPWESSSLVSDFSFFPASSTQPAAADMRTATSWNDRLARLSPAKAYEVVIEADSVEAYEVFLSLHARDTLTSRIRLLLDRRVEMIAWYSAVSINSVRSFEAFLARYPDSDLAATAKRLLERAKNRALANSADPAFSAMAALAPAETSAATPKIVERIVEKIVEKPVVVEKVVSVPGACPCDCERKTEHRPSRPRQIVVEEAEPVRHGHAARPQYRERYPRMRHPSAGWR